MTIVYNGNETITVFGGIMLMVNGVKVDEVHIERAKALQAYAYANGMRVPNIRAIVERADKAGMGDRTKGFDYLDNGAPLLA